MLLYPPINRYFHIFLGRDKFRLKFLALPPLPGKVGTPSHFTRPSVREPVSPGAEHWGLDRAVVVTVKLNPNLDPSVILLLFSAGVDLRPLG